MNERIKTLCVVFMMSCFSMAVYCQEASDELIEMVEQVHSACPRAFVPGVKLKDVEIDDEFVVCTFSAEDGVFQRGGLNSERNKESMKQSLIKNFRRMSRTSILRKMAEEVSECDMGVKGIVESEGSGESLEVVITNEEMREATGKQNTTDEDDR